MALDVALLPNRFGELQSFICRLVDCLKICSTRRNHFVVPISRVQNENQGETWQVSLIRISLSAMCESILIPSTVSFPSATYNISKQSFC